MPRKIKIVDLVNEETNEKMKLRIPTNQLTKKLPIPNLLFKI